MLQSLRIKSCSIIGAGTTIVKNIGEACVMRNKMKLIEKLKRGIIRFYHYKCAG